MVRYEVRKNPDNQYRTVFDIETNAPAFINDMPMDRLEELEAEQVLELIKAAFIEPKKFVG